MIFCLPDHRASSYTLAKFPSVCPGSPMSDVTRILSAIHQGNSHAADELLPLVYDELRKLAAQKLSQEAPGWKNFLFFHPPVTFPVFPWIDR